VSGKNIDLEELSRLALRGLAAGAFAATCSVPVMSLPDPHASYTPAPSWAGDQKYYETHSCAGLNVCKGLGGCAVTAEKLAMLAEKAGISAEMAGEPHSCSGLNACRGLGGCHVDQAKYDKLMAKLTENGKYKAIHSCAGLNICRGLGGCSVDAAKLEKLAAKAGVPMAQAGEPHSCSGLNACRGLGGCHVDAAKLEKLKEKRRQGK